MAVKDLRQIFYADESHYGGCSVILKRLGQIDYKRRGQMFSVLFLELKVEKKKDENVTFFQDLALGKHHIKKSQNQ